MDARHTDPWAPEPGFEPYQGPQVTDAFATVDLQTFDLRSFLRSDEIQRSVGRPKETIETVVLPDGTHGQLKQRAADDWELVVHLRRDFYQVFTGTHSKVLETANAVHRARPC